MNEKKGLENLEAWRRSMDFAKRVHAELLPCLPDEEKWAMASDMRRAVQSVPAYIAEGYGRRDHQEGVRMDETITRLTLAQELGYVPQELGQGLRVEADELKRCIHAYAAELQRSKPGQREPALDYKLSSVFDGPSF
jgi:four helix bundle protein